MSGEIVGHDQQTFVSDYWKRANGAAVSILCTGTWNKDYSRKRAAGCRYGQSSNKPDARPFIFEADLSFQIRIRLLWLLRTRQCGVARPLLEGRPHSVDHRNSRLRS